jgi:asparagine synthase (glutamine-hydrolysing)
MSGVFGVVDPTHQMDLNRLCQRMGDSMRHRPWMTFERHIDDGRGWALGLMNIGEFNDEQQPVWSEDRSVGLVFSGELEPESPESVRSVADSQFALQQYLKLGAAFLEGLQGSFILALVDHRRRAMMIANDRLGTYPTYFARFGGRFLFAPEVKALLCDPAADKQLDLTALAEYMRFQFLLGDKTFFRDVKLLPNASRMWVQLDAGEYEVEPYWDLGRLKGVERNIGFEDAVDETGKRLRDAVARSGRGGQRAGLYLSGGLDSRVIAGFMQEAGIDFSTATYGLPTSRDFVYGNRLAKRLRTKHSRYPFPSGEWVRECADFHLDLTEGFHSWIHSHGISTLEPMRQSADVVITGFGGDQTAIAWDDEALYSEPDDATFLTKMYHLLSQRTTWPSLNEAEERLLYSERLSKELRGRAFESLRHELTRFANLEPIQRARYFALCNPDRRLFQYYTTFYRSHFEVRFPFYSQRYFDFVYRLPPAYIAGRKLRRAVVRRFLPGLTRVPYDRDNLPIGADAMSRLFWRGVDKAKKAVHRRLPDVFEGLTTLYADYESWLRNDLRDWGRRRLLGSKLRTRGLFNDEFLTALWNRQMSGLEVNMIGKIAPIITYEMMLERFVD